MGRLIYSAIQSLDGYIADENGDFGWAAPDREVHAHVNDLARPVGTYLLGRRTYDVLAVWDSDDILVGEPEEMSDFAQIWRASDKVVYSRTLAEPYTARTRLERAFDPHAVRRLKEEAERDLAVGGPELAAEAFQAGLVDELQIFVAPTAVGAGTQSLPDGVRLDMTLTDERRFESGFVLLRYSVRG